MTTSDTTPVIVGAGEVVQRPGPSREAGPLGPIELMVGAARAAGADAGAEGLLARVEWVGVTDGWIRYRNPGALVARAIDAPLARSALIGISGTAPQDLVALAADRIARGEIEVALVVGGEARWSQARHDRAGSEPEWITEPGEGDPESWPMYAGDVAVEGRILGGAPAGYALFEDSLRHAHGRTIDEQRDVAARLWSDFSAIAAANPYAWHQESLTPEAVRDATAENRMVASPYTLAMVANNTVDMASAVLVCSARAAREAGVPPEHCVFPLVAAASHETWLVAQRPRLHGLPGLAAAGRAAYAHVGVGADDMEHVDLYGCFPSIVQMSSAVLGFGLDRRLTLTGGLGFAGGAVGNAVGHSMAAMVRRVRSGGYALVHGNGGMATKHSVAIYASSAERPFARIDLAKTEELEERATLATDWSGPVTVEAATVVCDRSGPTRLLAAVLDGSGARGFAATSDAAAMETAMAEGVAGASAHRDPDGLLAL